MSFARLNTEEEVRSLISWHSSNSEFVVIDVETTDKAPRKASLVDVQLSGKDENSAVIFSTSLVGCLAGLSESLILVAHNYKYDAHVLFRHGVDLLSRRWRDTMLLGHLLDENRGSYSLDSYVKEHWDDDYKERFWRDNPSYESASEGDRLEYACKDVVYTGLLYRKEICLSGGSGVPGSLCEHVHRLQSSLLRTEIDGIKIDQDYLKEKGVEIKQKIDELGPKLRAAAKDAIEAVELEGWLTKMSTYKTDKGRTSVKRPEFNWQSPQQLQKLLYGRLGLTVQKKNRVVTTEADALDRIKGEHPLVPLLLQYRQYPVVYNTFIQGTVEKQDGGRVYPSFLVNGTKGSRIAHAEPNMGNIPKEGGIKGIFVPEDGEEFAEFDYAQLEVCIEAHLTQDKNLLDIVINGASKHDITAQNLKIDRSLAKTLNFAMQYWCSHHKVAKLLKCPEKEALYIYNKYWETYSGPAKLKAETDKMIDGGVPLVDIFGRRRRFEIRKRHPWEKDYRSGYNFRIQSPGGQMMNNAYYKSDEFLRRFNLGRGVLTVHDSGLMGLKKGTQAEAASRVTEFMVNEGGLAKLTVPLKVSVNLGMSRWLDK